jgi:light-regulated signal transduction histidine kinase (bacteriophytochrome)
MKTLINDLLALSRIGTRGRALEPTDVKEACARAIDVLHNRIAESGAVIETGELPTVRADKLQLSQLFQNLIGNAIKYRGDQTPRIRIEANQQDGEWIFSVRDNGIGIDPKFADRVFVIFQRLHGHGEYEGTGIGLAICKKIVERMGGRIWVESRPREGATIFFTAPAATSPP